MIGSAVRSFLLAVAVGTCAFANAADTYPQRPIRFLIPQSPGGASDTVGRIVAQRLAERMAQQFVVDNRPGATGNIGHELVAHASPDGYTMLLTAPNLVTSPSLFAKLAYDPLRDFTPITQMTLSPNVWLVHPSFAARSMKDLIDIARAKPGAIDFASSGLASTQHLAGELLNFLTGIRLAHVPYKGGGPALIDLIAGRVMVMSSSLPSAVPHIKSGKVRALAVGTPKRSPSLPDVPTVAEQGYPGFDASLWLAFMAPAGTPAPVIDRLQKEIHLAVNAKDTAGLLDKNGAEPLVSTPAELAALIKDGVGKYAKVVKAAGVKPE